MSDLDKLAADLRSAPARLSKSVRATTFRAAKNIKDSANDNAPAPVGRTVDFEIDQDAHGVTASIEAHSPFGAIFEFGSPSLPGGRPFMEPATDAEVPVWEKYLAEAIGDLL